MIGEFLSFTAALAFAIANVAIAKASLGGKDGDNGALLSVVLTTVFSGVLWVAMSAPVESFNASEEPRRGVAYFMLAGVLATVFGRLALFEAIRLAGAVRASVLRRTIPLFATSLAFLVLNEALSLAGVGGLVLIVVSFVMLFSDGRMQRKLADGAGSSSRAVSVGQFYGLMSAFSYGSAFVARKLGLDDLTDPALGALISSLAALLWFAVSALFVEKYRASFRGILKTAGVWQTTAATAMSLGQICQFFALKNADVAVVAIIGSVEIFLSAYIAVFLLRTEKMPNRATIAASLVATAGVILVALF